MAPGRPSAMIEGMVALADDQLKEEPGDADGWARLVRSYKVLGRADDARPVLERGRAAPMADAAKLAIVDEAARASGLTGTMRRTSG